MRKRERSFKKSLVTKWIISYYVVAVIPFIFFAVFAFLSSSLLRSSVNVSNTVTLKTIARIIDSALEENGSLSEDFVISNTLRSKLFYSEPSELTSQDFYELSNEIRHLANGYRNISETLIFSPDEDIYVSTLRWGNMEELAERNEFNLPKNAEEIIEIFNGADRRKMSIVDGSSYSYLGSRNNKLLVLKSLNIAGQGSSSSFFIASEINTDSLIPAEIDLYDDLLIINNESGEVLFDFNGKLEGSERVSRLSSLSEGNSVNFDNAMALAAKSAYPSLKYVLLINRTGYVNYVRQLMIFSLVLFILSFLLASILVLSRIRKDWSSYENALKSAGIGEAELTLENSSYDPFVNTSRKAMEREEYLGAVIHRQSESLKSVMVARLFNRSDAELISTEALKECGIEFLSDNFSVMLVRAKDSECLGERINSSLEGLGIRVLPFNYKLGLGYILNLPSQMKVNDFYIEVAKACHEIADSEHNIEAIGLSDVSGGIERLGEDYLDAINAIEYIVSLQIKDVMFSRDVYNTSTKSTFSYNSDDELRLSEAIEKGSSSEALEIVDALVRKNYEKKLSPRNMRCFLFSIAGTLVRTTNKIRMQYSWDIPELSFSSIMQSESFQQSLEEVKESIGNTCEFIDKERSNTASDDEYYLIYRRAIKEVRANYSDPALNVTELSSRLNVSNVILSKQFKKYHGMNISEYISSYRISMAKKYLLEGAGINEVTERCGFGSIRTFLRLFKSYENVTPTQYKAMRSERLE